MQKYYNFELNDLSAYQIDQFEKLVKSNKKKIYEIIGIIEALVKVPCLNRKSYNYRGD